MQASKNVQPEVALVHRIVFLESYLLFSVFFFGKKCIILKVATSTTTAENSQQRSWIHKLDTLLLLLLGLWSVGGNIVCDTIQMVFTVPFVSILSECISKLSQCRFFPVSCIQSIPQY